MTYLKNEGIDMSELNAIEAYNEFHGFGDLTKLNGCNDVTSAKAFVESKPLFNVVRSLVISLTSGLTDEEVEEITYYYCFAFYADSDVYLKAQGMKSKNFMIELSNSVIVGGDNL